MLKLLHIVRRPLEPPFGTTCELGCTARTGQPIGAGLGER